MGHFSGTETYWDGYSAWPFFIPKEPHQSQQRTRKVAYFFTLKRTKTGRRNGLLPKPNWTTYIRSDTQIALNLTKITDLDEAAAWGAQLHEYGTIYRDWMNQKTFTTDPATRQRAWSWTHERTRKAYNSLNHLWRGNLLLVYLAPPDGVLDASRIKATKQPEGGINAQLKLLARTHRGRSGNINAACWIGGST